MCACVSVCYQIKKSQNCIIADEPVVVVPSSVLAVELSRLVLCMLELARTKVDIRAAGMDLTQTCPLSSDFYRRKRPARVFIDCV